MVLQMACCTYNEHTCRRAGLAHGRWRYAVACTISSRVRGTHTWPESIYTYALLHGLCVVCSPSPDSSLAHICTHAWTHTFTTLRIHHCMWHLQQLAWSWADGRLISIPRGLAVSFASWVATGAYFNGIHRLIAWSKHNSKAYVAKVNKAGRGGDRLGTDSIGIHVSYVA